MANYPERFDDDTPLEGWEMIVRGFRSKGIRKSKRTLWRYHTKLGMPLLRNAAGWPMLRIRRQKVSSNPLRQSNI